MRKDGMNDQNLEKTKAHLATLSREELCEFMITESKNLLDKLEQISKNAEQTTPAIMPLLAETKKEVEKILGEEYFKALCTLKDEEVESI